VGTPPLFRPRQLSRAVNTPRMAKNVSDVGCPAALTFLIQLPVDMRLPQGVTLLAYERPDDVEFALLVDTHDTKGALVPDTRFVFRRSSPDVSLGRSLVMEVFSDFWDGLAFRDSEVAFEEVQRSVSVSVVAATTGVMGKGAVLTEQEITDAFDRVLSQLNRLLTMVGFTVNDPDIGPLRRTELPSHIATLIDLFETPRTVELSTLQLHSFGEDPPGEDAILYGHDLAFRDRRGWPFEQTIESLQRARRELHGGETQFGVLLLGLASELLISTTVRECMKIDGKSDVRVAGVAAAPFRSIREDHFAPLLDRIGADSAALVEWTKHCYLLRNAVAHEGRRPTHDEALAALRCTLRLAGELGDKLRASREYGELGVQLPL
jgi:hypothetical protein